MPKPQIWAVEDSNGFFFTIDASGQTYTVRVRRDGSICVFHGGPGDYPMRSDYAAETIEDAARSLEDFDFNDLMGKDAATLEVWFWRSVNHEFQDPFFQNVDNEGEPLHFLGGTEGDFKEGIALATLVWDPECEEKIWIRTGTKEHYAGLDDDETDYSAMNPRYRSAIDAVIETVSPEGGALEYDDGAREQQSGYRPGPIRFSVDAQTVITNLPARVRLAPELAFATWLKGHGYRGDISRLMQPSKRDRPMDKDTFVALVQAIVVLLDVERFEIGSDGYMDVTPIDKPIHYIHAHWLAELFDSVFEQDSGETLTFVSSPSSRDGLAAKASFERLSALYPPPTQAIKNLIYQC